MEPREKSQIGNLRDRPNSDQSTDRYAALSIAELIEACARSLSGDAWDEFVRRFHPLIASVARRVCERWGVQDAAEIDDVIQEIYLKLCDGDARALADFEAQHPDAAFAFVKVIATNAARDHMRARNAEKRGAGQTQPIDSVFEQIGITVDIERNVTLEQLHEIVAEQTDGANGVRDRAIFSLYFRDGMSAQAISELPGIDLGPKGVEGVLHRLTRAVKKMVDGTQEAGAQLRS